MTFDHLSMLSPPMMLWLIAVDETIDLINQLSIT